MSGYKPHFIAGYQTGLIQERVAFTLPQDAFTVLRNAYVWRERVIKKRGAEFFDRVKRRFENESLGTATSGTWEFNIFDNIGITDPHRELAPGSLTVNINGTEFKDNGRGVLEATPADNDGTVNYATGDIAIEHTQGAVSADATFNYFPGRPIMGIRTFERQLINFEDTLVFDTKYAYQWGSGHGFTEYLPGENERWNGSDSNFFWSVNFWESGGENIFWVSNFVVSPASDRSPTRWTQGTDWNDFTPQIDNATPNNVMWSAKAFVPFQGHFVFFNTLEGDNTETIENADHFPQRVRWSIKGNPFATNAFNSEELDNAGFVDIPTSEHIMGIGWVRDIVVIFCERSTFQLRNTNIAAPAFMLERVNTEIGSEALFSTVQFDTSVAALGDKGIIESDGFKAQRMDQRIPDLTYRIQRTNDGRRRIHGIRNFRDRLAYWIYPKEGDGDPHLYYPNKRLVFDYESGGWAEFDDNFTALGRFYKRNSLTWEQATFPWQEANFPWLRRIEQEEIIFGGSPHGFLSRLDRLNYNEPNLTITAVTPDGTAPEDTPTIITSPRHGLKPGQVISIENIPKGTDFARRLNNPKTGAITDITQADPAVVTSDRHNLETGNIVSLREIEGMTELNGFRVTVTVIDDNSFSIDDDTTNFSAYTGGGIWRDTAPNKFSVSQVIDEDKFQLARFSNDTGVFSIDHKDPSDFEYVGGGRIGLMDNFEIRTRQFTHANQGKGTQFGYVDLFTDASNTSEIALKVFANYSNSAYNSTDDGSVNMEIPLRARVDQTSNKAWQRVTTPVYGSFVQLLYTHTDAQMAGRESEGGLSISAQVLYMRAAGKNFVSM